MKLFEFDDLTPNSGLPSNNKSETVGIIFGRFNPPHKGHKTAWEMASTNDHWYVGTNKNTHGPKDPLPYDIKIKAMEAVWPNVAEHIIPHKSWLTLAAEVYAGHGDVTLNVYTDEAWVMKALTKYNDVENPVHGYYNFTSIVANPTPRLSSATAVRDAVKNNDREAFEDAAGVGADTIIDGKEYFDLVATHLEKFSTTKKPKVDKYNKITKELNMNELDTLRKLAGLNEAAPVNYNTDSDVPGYEPEEKPDYDTSPIKQHDKKDKVGARTYEPTSPKDAKAASGRSGAAAGSNPSKAQFSPANDNKGSAATYSVANRFGVLDPSDKAARQEVFLGELVKSPTALLGEINARLANDDNSLAVSDRLSDIIGKLGGDKLITELEKSDKEFALRITANAIKNMPIQKGVDSEPEMESVDLSDIRSEYGIVEDSWDDVMDDSGRYKQQSNNPELDDYLKGSTLSMTDDEEEVDESSSRRLISKFEKGNRAVKIYKDTEWGEFIVQFYEDGEYNQEADYHTDDKEDAVGTAKHFFLNGGTEIDEISKKSKDSYVSKAVDDHGHANMARRHSHEPKEKEYWSRREKNRKKGISRALSNESQIEETAANALDAAMAELRKLAGLN